MAEEHKKGFNADMVWEDLENCCLRDSSCAQCQEQECTIGYAKECIRNFQKAPKKEVPEGIEHIARKTTRKIALSMSSEIATK